MASCRQLCREPLGIEHVWSLPEGRMTMCNVGEDQHVSSFGNRVATDLIVAESTTAQAPGWWIEAHRFLDHHASKGESRKILDHRGTPVQHLLIFLLEPC